MNRKTTKKVDESTLTTLCAVCRGAFLDAKGVHLRRADPRQPVKDVCTYCQTRYGFDYYVQPIVRKSKMTGKENRRETEPVIWMNADFIKSISFISARACRIIVVFPVLRKP